MLHTVGSVIASSKKPTWAEKLRDDRWENLRRYVVASHKFCHSCRRSDVVLNVHHPKYDGREPWEYDQAELVVLCGDCHKEMHKTLEVLRAFVSQLNSTDAKIITGLFINVIRSKGPGHLIRLLSDTLL